MPRIPFSGGGQALTAPTGVTIQPHYRLVSETNPFGRTHALSGQWPEAPPRYPWILSVPKFPPKGKITRDSGSNFLGNVIYRVGHSVQKALPIRKHEVLPINIRNITCSDSIARHIARNNSLSLVILSLFHHVKFHHLGFCKLGLGPPTFL